MGNDERLYLLAKSRTLQVFDGLDDDQRAMICPSCPAWTVQDVLAHHIHFFGELVAAGMPPDAIHALIGDPERRAEAAAARDSWTEAGVTARRSRTVDDLAREWETIGLPANVRLTAIGRTDLTLHLADILETFGDRRGPDSELVEATLRSYYDAVAVVRCGEAGQVPVLRCTDTGTRLGAGPSAPEIAGPAYEILRAIGGRRTRGDADEHLDWGRTTEPVRAAFSVYGWPTT
jgi:uncharacterized protein (TIGR03083 family)